MTNIWYFRLAIKTVLRGVPIKLLAVLAIAFSFTTFLYAQGEPDNRQDAIAVFNEAQDAHEKGDLATAIELYKKAVKLVPEFAEADYQMGNAYLGIKDRTAAEAAFRKALEIRPDWTLPMSSLGSLLIQKGNYDEAATLLTKALETDDRNVQALSALAELRLKTGAAASVLQDLLDKVGPLTGKANPTASLWTARAALENALGRHKDAKISLANAIALDPNNVFALSELASSALADNDNVKASEAVDKLEKLAPSDSTRLLRARVLAADGRTTEALKVMERIDPATPGADQFMSRLKVAVSENSAELEKLLENDARNSAVLGRLCKLNRLSNPTKALDYCRRAAEADPSNVDHVIGYGAALVQARKFGAAVALFQRLIAVVPDNSTAHANLASALFELKRYNEAKTEYRWLIARQPELAVAYYLLAVTHDHLEEYMDAMANYQQFLRLAKPAKNQLEIDKVNLRLPSLQRLIKDNKGKKG
jgi:tetratricopeptide (TPR) repeat protein